MDRNRQTIEEASARLFREQGLKGLSVDDLMAAAGLTHGGFYGHFQSKDALAAIACAKAFEQSGCAWKGHINGEPDPSAAFKGIVAGYLSERSRDNPGTSCPATALAGDVAREPGDKPVRAAFIAGVKDQVGLLLALGGHGDGEADRRKALVQFATLVGALLLARATRGDTISQEFLEAAGAHLIGPEGSGL
jgi:TetR/AcrR family transcriptional repressor of nem operon